MCKESLLFKERKLIDLLLVYQGSKSVSDWDEFLAEVYTRYTMLIPGWWLYKDTFMCLDALRDETAEIIHETFTFRKEYWLEFDLSSAYDDGVVDVIVRRKFNRAFGRYNSWLRKIVYMYDCEGLKEIVRNDFEAKMDIEERGALLQRVLDCITLQQKEVIQLKLEGLSDAIIAARLEVEIGAVRNRYFRAILKMRKKIQPKGLAI